MTLDEPMRNVEQALGELKRAIGDAQGWSDDARKRFDKNRLDPLLDAGSQLLRALAKAQELHHAATNLVPK